MNPRWNKPMRSEFEMETISIVIIGLIIIYAIIVEIKK